jgi:hypothetical protein
VTPRDFTLPVMREDRGRFASLRGERVFIYWPHGLGDWVHLGAILPLFEPSNEYAIARFGDDYSCILERNLYVRVLRSGVRVLGDGSLFGTKHLGLELLRINGKAKRLNVPDPLCAELEAFDPTAVLWTDYPETEGRTAFPYHTKARHLAHILVAGERLASFDLRKPLANTIDFGVEPKLQARVAEPLERVAPRGTKRYVLSISGYTAERKNWEPAQARAFVGMIARHDPKVRMICMEDPALGDPSPWPGQEIAFGYRQLFGEIDAPFARVFSALLARTNALIGVPAGPFHVAMARGGFPIVGLWHAHLPEWYDEPNSDAVHLIGSYVREKKFDRRPATKTLPPNWHKKVNIDSPVIPAEAVIEALHHAKS